MFLEDDLVLSENYLRIIDDLIAKFADDRRVGYVAAYGDHRRSLEEQRQNRNRLIPLDHNWAFALYRRQWTRMRPRVLQYLDIVKNVDYTEKDGAKIKQLFSSWGFGCPAISQDAAKTMACNNDNVIKLNTFACHGKYIGKYGTHMNPGIFRDRGYEQTVVCSDYPEKLEDLTDALYRSVLGHQLEWAGKAAAADHTQNRGSVSASDIVPRMSEAELHLFSELLDTATNYLEYGSGGSTIVAAQSRVQRIVSIETDGQWLEKLREHPDIAPALASGRLIFRHVDVGPVGEWGVPRDEDKLRNWPKYAVEPFVATDLDFDTVLVDGRFRVHCLLAIANCARSDCRIFFHDYHFRHGYSVVDKYFDTLERADSTVVLHRRRVINQRSLYVDLINNLFAV